MTSGFYKYAELIANGTTYAKRMTRLRAKIFGEVAREVTSPSMKVVKLLSAQPLEQDPMIKQYYPRYRDIGVLMANLRKHGLYRDEHEDFKEEMLRLRILRGKGPKKRERKGNKEADK